jgi:hypothetical protein
MSQRRSRTLVLNPARPLIECELSTIGQHPYLEAAQRRTVIGWNCGAA